MTTPRSPSSRGGSVIMSAAARRIMLKLPIRLTLTTRAKSASGIGPSLPTMRAAGAMPAQLTRTRAAPCLARAAATAASALLASDTSQWSARPPVSFATASAPGMFTSRTATLAPAFARYRAVSATSPEPPPVTIAACPPTSMILIPLLPNFSAAPQRRALPYQKGGGEARGVASGGFETPSAPSRSRRIAIVRRVAHDRITHGAPHGPASLAAAPRADRQKQHDGFRPQAGGGLGRRSAGLCGTAPLLGGGDGEVLELGLGVLRRRRGDTRQCRDREPGGDAGCPLLPQRPAQLRGEPAAAAGRRRRPRLLGRGQGAAQAELARAPRRGLAPRPGHEGARDQGGRPGRRLAAQHAGSDHRDARGHQPRRGVVVELPRFRRAGRPRSLRADRAQASLRRGRLFL